MTKTLSGFPFAPRGAFLLLVAVAALEISCSHSYPATSPPASIDVASIDGVGIPFTELKEEYERTSALESEPNADTLAAYQDFLERYVDFRLKVKEAMLAGYGDLPDLNEEIAGYRAQLARPHLLDREVTEPLIHQLYERRRTMVEASHILISVAPNAAPEDTLRAFERLLSIADSARSGVPFDELAFRNSDDPSARSAPGSPGYRGYLGFFAGGRMVDEFEDQAYATETGELSPVFRTQFGYHILKVLDKRDLPGDIRFAHIMVQPKGSTAADSAAARARIDSVWTRLRLGDEFAALARAASDDRGSAPRGGELQRFSFDAGLPAALRDSAYALEPGQYSRVVESPFGFHIVKVLERFEPESYEEAYPRLKARLGQMPRAKKAERRFAARKRKELGGRYDTLRVEAWLQSMGADSLVRALTNNTFSSAEDASVIARVGSSEFSLSQFAAYFRESTETGSVSARDRIYESLERFLDDKAIEDEVSALEERDPDFAATMRDFREGLVLFRLMEDSVWNAAAEDTTHLLAHYHGNEGAYMFGDRTRIISFASASDSLLGEISLRLQAGRSVSEEVAAFAGDTTRVVHIDTTRIEGKTNSVFDAVLGLNAGGVTNAMPYNDAYIVLYNDGIEPSRKKTFSEARAQVVNEYQAILEQRLIRRLRSRYRVTLHPDRLASMLSEGAPGGSNDD